jgi:hypothetical protein
MSFAENPIINSPFDKPAWHFELDTRPKHGRICVKVINHFGDEVQKVFLV